MFLKSYTYIQYLEACINGNMMKHEYHCTPAPRNDIASAFSCLHCDSIYIYICVCKYAQMHALSGDATDTQVLGDDISSLETLPVSGLEMGFSSW